MRKSGGVTEERWSNPCCQAEGTCLVLTAHEESTHMAGSANNSTTFQCPSVTKCDNVCQHHHTHVCAAAAVMRRFAAARARARTATLALALARGSSPDRWLRVGSLVQQKLGEATWIHVFVITLRRARDLRPRVRHGRRPRP